MTLLKKLLLFGGVPAAGASAAAAPFVLKQLKNEGAKGQVENLEEFDEKEDVGNIDISGIETTTNKKDEQIKILKKAGLFCGNSLEDGNVCRLYSGGFRLKNGSIQDGLKFSSSPKGKLVLRKNKNTYSYGLRLAVEVGEISLEASGKTQKLERFESYSIEAEEGQGGGKKLYLVKKESHQQGVMRALGIPSNCELPVDGQTRQCTPLTSTQIKNVHFDGRKEGGATIADSTKTISLSISKSVDTNLFNQGYRFAFSSPSEITIKEGDVIRSNASTEFTVKDWKDENMVLVRAGSGEKEGEFFSKVGLKCDSSNVCTIEEGKLNVIKGENNNKLTTGKRTGKGNGTIKLHRDQANYINGLKFSIEKEDITISGNPTDSPVNRLSVFDGYEIVETEKKFYLKRKHEGLAEIVKKLGLLENPSGSVENSSEPIFTTTVSSPNSKKIKFYLNNKPANITENKAIDVKGYRTTDTTTYKYGYRFSLTSSGGDITIGNTTLKGNVSYDFKIREESGEFYLERTIDPAKIIDLVGLNCTGSVGDETCTFKNGQANIRHWDRNITGANAETTGTGIGKLKLTRDQSGFTDGFKFTVEEGDITFTGGTIKTGNIRMAEFEEYEIMRENGTWFLNQKKNFMQQKYGVLGIDEKCNNQFYGHCEMEGNNVADKVKFKARKNSNVKGTFTNNSKVHIRLIKDPQYQTGIKVAMKVEGGDDERNISIVCNSNDNKSLFKLTKEEVEFKIEKDGSSFYLTKIGGQESNETCNSP